MYCCELYWSKFKLHNQAVLNYGPLDMLFRFFRYLIYVYLARILSKTLSKNHHFLTETSKIHFKMQLLNISLLNIRMSKFVIWNITQNLKKALFYLGPEYVFLTYFLKDCTKKVLKICKSIVITNFKPVLLCPIKWRPPLKVLDRITKKSSFNS